MTRAQYFLGLLLCAVVGVVGAADKPTVKPAAPGGGGAKATNEQVIAYYFHGTVRCETCQKIERQAREVIEQTLCKTTLATVLALKRSKSGQAQDFSAPVKQVQCACR